MNKSLPYRLPPGRVSMSQIVMPDTIRHPVSSWIPAPAPDADPGFAGMTNLRTVAAVVIMALSLFIIPVTAPAAPPVSVEILYMNHGPLLSTVRGIKELCDGYGKAVTASWYDFESPEGEKFMAKKGIRQHIPLVVWIAGKPAAKVNGKEVQFVGFPTGSGPPSFQGKWTLADLRLALDQAAGKK